MSCLTSSKERNSQFLSIPFHSGENTVYDTSIYKTDLISGIWKFSRPKIALDVIVQLAQEFLDEEPDKYLGIHVRKCSQTQIGISFIYDMGENSDTKSYDEFFNSKTDKLKRRFGNDFVGWDTTRGVWLLK